MAIRVSVSRHIPAPPDRVWAVASALDDEPKYWKGTVAVRVIDRGGNDVHRLVTLAFRDRTSEERVHLEPPRRVTHEIVGGPMAGRKTVEVTPEGEGTRLTATWDLRLRGFLKLGQSFVRGHIEDGTRAALERIDQAAVDATPR